jgi:hypothetical protein
MAPRHALLLLPLALGTASGLVAAELAPRRPAGRILVAQAPQRPVRRWSLQLERQLRQYEAALDASPMRTQMTTAAVLAGVGDVIAQRLEGASGFAWRRFASLVTVNVLYIVPLLSFFYAANERLVGQPAARHGELARTGACVRAVAPPKYPRLSNRAPVRQARCWRWTSC